jgi:hypothetical protein
MSILRGINTFFGFSSDGAALAKIGTGIEAVKGSAVAATAATESMGAAWGGMKALIAGMVGSRIAGMFTGYADDAAQIGKQSAALGISAESYQVYRQAAKDAGVEGEQFTMLLGKLGSRAAQAASGNAEMAATFQKLGVDVRDSAGQVLPLEDVMARVLDAFEKMPAGPARSAMAMKLFEEAGTKMIPFLAKGTKGANELREAMRRSGAMIGGESIAQAEKYRTSLKATKLALDGVKNTIGAALLPTMERGLKWISQWINSAGRLNQIIAALKVAAMVAGMALAWMAAKAAATAMLSLLNPVTLVVAALVAMYLIVDDLVAFWQGRPSLIGDMLPSGAADDLRSFLAVLKKVGGVMLWVAMLPWTIIASVQALLAWMNGPLPKDGWLFALHLILNGIKATLKFVIDGLYKVGKYAGMLNPINLATRAATFVSEAASGAMTPEERAQRDEETARKGLINNGMGTNLLMSPAMETQSQFDWMMGAIQRAQATAFPTSAAPNIEAALAVSPRGGEGRGIGGVLLQVGAINIPVKTDASAEDIANAIDAKIGGMLKSTLEEYQMVGA